MDRRAYLCPRCGHGLKGREVVRWHRAGWMIVDASGVPRAIATSDAGPPLWTCYGGCKPAHVVAAGSPLALRLDNLAEPAAGR